MLLVAPLVKGNRIGEFVVEATLGEGSLAVVVRARHVTSGAVHAVKVLKTDDERALERALQEARVMAQLQHENIAAITDVVSFDGGSGLVMEYVPGGSFAQLLCHADLTLPQVDHLVWGVLQGVAAAHAHRLVHRDIKPDNILLDVRGNTLVPKLSDFGLAKVQHVSGHLGPRTFAGATMGSPAYMAPEQYEDAGDVDATTDLFACAAVFWELLAGERAYTERDPVRIYRDMLREERSPLPDHVPARVRNTLAAALHPNREERPQSAEEMLELWFDGQDPPTVPTFRSETVQRVLEDGRGRLELGTLPPAEDRVPSRVPTVVLLTGMGLALGAGIGALLGAVVVGLLGLALG